MVTQTKDSIIVQEPGIPTRPTDQKMITSKIKIWWLAIRPKTLSAAFAPVLMGTSMAYADGQMHIFTAITALIGALMIQIGTNLANDYFDYMKGADTEERLGPTRVTQAGLVHPTMIRKAFVWCFVIAFLVGSYLMWRGGWPVVLIGVLSIASGIAYTAGPYPLGYNGLGDIFVLIFFGPVAVGGTYYCQTLTINHYVLLAGLSPGLLAMAILAINNLRDIPTDKKAGKRTLAVFFGPLFARMEYLLSILVACAIPVYLHMSTQKHPYVLLTLLVLVIAIPTLWKVFRTSEGPQLNQALASTGKILMIFSILFTIGWVM